eukprot:955589-Pelagomonas_calceolata.AAC.8
MAVQLIRVSNNVQRPASHPISKKSLPKALSKFQVGWGKGGSMARKQESEQHQDAPSTVALHSWGFTLQLNRHAGLEWYGMSTGKHSKDLSIGQQEGLGISTFWGG